MKAEHTFGSWYSRSRDFLSRNCGVSETQWLSFASIVASGGAGEELDSSIAALISGGADLAVIAAALVELSKVMGKDDDKPLFSPFLSPIQVYLHRRLGARGNKIPIYRLSAGTISLFEDSPAAIYLFTSSGQLATANRAGIALIGQQRMAPLQRRLSLQEHPFLVDPPLSSLKRSLAGEAVSLNSVTLDPAKWGADMGGRVFSIAASPISLSDDRVDFILISVAETIGSEGGEQVRRFTRQVEMLGKIAQTVGLEGNLERAMADVLGKLTETVFVGSTLFLVDGEELIMHSWSGIPEPFARRQAILQVGQMSPGRCAQSGALTTLDPVSIEDEESRLMLVSGFVSRVNLPIIFHGRTIGVLSLLGNRKVQLTRELRFTLEAVGAQIGMGIENSRMVADLQRRADSLEIQRDLTQEMMDAMGDAVLALDSNEKIAFHNQRFYDLTRYTKEELSGKPWRDFVSGGSEAFQNVLSESREKGEPVFCECRWRKNDGSSFSGFTGICPRLGADGGLAGFVVSIADLTERRHLEELLARQNEELRLLNEVADVIATSMEISDVGRDALEIISSRFDANFSVIYLPADSDGHLQARASVGLTDSELLRVEFCSAEGIVGSAFKTGEIQEHLGRGAKELIEGLRENYRVIAVPLEARGQICGVLVIGRAGRRKFLESDLRLLRILSPQLGISLTNLSLVESMQAEAAKSAGLAQITTELLASPAEERFTALALQRIIDSLALDFAAILRVTPEVCTVAGCAPNGCPDGLDTFAKALPQLLDTLDTEENRWIERAQKADNKIIRDFAASGGIKSMALIPVVVNGRRKALLLLVQTQFARRFPQLDREFIRALAGQFSLAYRSSELVRELRSANMELQTLDEMKSNLLANVSHELRTPLVSVRGYIEMTLGGFLGEVSERQSKGLRVALRNVDRLVALIENLLNFARMERGDEKLQLTRFVLADLVAEIAAGFDPVLRDRGINLIVEIPGSIELFADREKILRLLTNLLDNAAKFTPKQGNISVSAGLDDRGTHTNIEVGDSGPGIPPDERERIFERFYQVDSASTRRFGGTGIGLSICRDIVRMHGGDITALSSPLGGALMRVSIPIPSKDLATSGESVEDRIPPLLLLNSFSSPSGDLLEKAFRSCAYNVVSISGFLATKAAALRHNPHIVVSDIYWPEDGCFKLLHSLRPRLQSTDLRFAVNCFFHLKNGSLYWFDGFLPTPLSLDVIRAALKPVTVGKSVLLLNCEDEVNQMLAELCASNGVDVSVADSNAEELPLSAGQLDLVLFDVSHGHRKLLSLLEDCLASGQSALPRIIALSSEAQPVDRDDVIILKGSGRTPISAKNLKASLSLQLANSPREQLPRRKKSGARSILVIDDEEEILELIKLILEPTGWEVHTLASGVGAVETVHRRKPDIVLLDIAMPGMDGLEVLSSLNAQPESSRSPVIILSARTDEETVSRARKAGARFYLSKPFRNADLLKIIEEALN